MKKINAILVGAVFAMAVQLFAAAPTVTAVTAQQRYPWNGYVDIVVTISGEESDVAAATCTFAATNSATQTALAITHVTQVGTDSGSGNVWTRRFLWDTNADVGEVKIADVELVVEVEGVDSSGGVQLWEDGPYWATCNVGASKPEEYGSYFMWGSTVGHKPSGDSFSDECFSSYVCPPYGKSNSQLQSLGYIDSSGNLTAAHDAATAHLGAPWRMPTDAEFTALRNNCNRIWTTLNGVNGWLVTGRGAYASKSIFLPAAGFGFFTAFLYAGSYGYYWSSTPYSGGDYICAWYLDFGWSYFQCDETNRDYGLSVRPLRDSSSSGNATVVSAASTHISLDNRTGVRVAESVEQIRFSPAWETDADGAIAQVSTNGVVVASASEAGTFEWTPTQDGTYEFTHAVYVNGVQVGETLTATFVVGLLLKPCGCDWTSGTIKLGWSGVAKDLNPITYSAWWSESDDPASCTNKSDYYVGETIFTPTKLGVQELTISDAEYLTRGDSLKPIYYHVVGTDGSYGFCKTRNRYGVVAAISSYEDKWQSVDMPNAASQAKSFAAELENSCEKSQNVKLLTDSEVNKDAYRNAISNCAAQAKSGDVFVSFLCSHGGTENGESVIAFYNKNSCYFAPEMADDISAFDSGVGFVGILYNCHAAEFVDPDADTSKWLEGTALAACTKNRAWIAAAGAEVSTPQDVFGLFLTEYGWKKGWADSAWETTDWKKKCNDYSALTSLVTFGALAGYTKQRMHELIWDECKSEPVIFDEFKILGNIAAGSRGTHSDIAKPEIPVLSVSKGTYNDKIVTVWSKSERADGYMLFQYRTDGEDYLKSGKRYKCAHYLLGDDVNSYSASGIGTTLCTDTFVVKAYNGCGVAKSEPNEGWIYTVIGNEKDVIFEFIKVGEDLVVHTISTESSWAFAPKIDIPETIDDCDVVAIAQSAFNGNDVVTGVTIPSTVTNIAAGAFGGCTNLSCVVFKGPLPDGVEQSEILSHATSVYYPRQYAQEYAQIVPATQFVCYSEFVDSSGNVWESEANKYKGQVALHSGAVSDGGVSEMNTTLTGVDELTFSWRTSCESPLELADGTVSQRDHAEFLVDGEVVATSDGESMWKEVTVNLSGGKSHMVTWRYVKDGSGSAGEDCVWVSDIQFTSIADEETTEELLDESEYNWFYEDTEMAFTDDDPFEYNPTLTPEDAVCQVDVCADLGVIGLDDLRDWDTDGLQAGIVKVSGAVGLEYAVLTSNGWMMVGNESIQASDNGEVKVLIFIDYSTSPSMVKYMIAGHTLTNVEGVSSFTSAIQKANVQALVTKGDGAINSWAGKYKVTNSDVQEVAVNTEAELTENLDTYSNETFRVTGGGTLVIPSDKVPAGGINRKLHIDGNSAVKFDLTGLTTIPTVMKLFNGVGNSFTVGSNMKLVVPGEGVERVSKLFVKDGNLEARVAERPTMDDSASGESPFNVSADGNTSTAVTSIGNAVEGFWYGLETTKSLNVDFSLDHDSVKQCTSTGSMKLESTANANSDAGFYRVSVSAEEP